MHFNVQTNKTLAEGVPYLSFLIITYEALFNNKNET
jgi:hypothetical protein